MQTSSFLDRALEEARRYGGDPWVFLRELAQNARDASARQIRVDTASPPGWQSIRFADDGRGMTFHHARAFLFRLYASSKESNRRAAGHFGIGFWSVLLWRPSRIVIQSRTATEAWGVELTDGLRVARRVPCELASAGTQIELTRPSAGPEIRDSVQERLGHYCRYIRRVDRKRLAVLCNGTRVDEEMSVEGQFSLSFSSRGASGVVGLGLRPRVELYARGLLVERVSFLEELLPGVEVPARSHQPRGLSPVILLNSERVDVVLSRQAPVDSRALRRLVRLGQKRVQRLVGHLIDRAVPQPWYWRLRDRVTGLYRAVGGAVGLGVIALWLVVLGLITALLWAPLWPSGQTSRAPGPSSPGVAPSPPEGDSERRYANINSYRGAVVDSPQGWAAPWALTYEDGPDKLLFKVLTLDVYDANRGWLPSAQDTFELYPGFGCGDRCITASVRVDAEGQRLVIPLPTGYRIETGSLRLNGQRLSPLLSDNVGQALIDLPEAGPSALTYRVGPAAWARPIAVSAPDVRLPDDLDRRVITLSRHPVRRRAMGITAAVRERLGYDVSSSAVSAFNRASGDWISRVFEVGAGDCDIKNGVNVIALRQAGVSARMAVGIPASFGIGESGLHAWTEYYVGGRWRQLDASGTPLPGSLPAAAPLAHGLGAASGSRASERPKKTGEPIRPRAPTVVFSEGKVESPRSAPPPSPAVTTPLRAKTPNSSRPGAGILGSGDLPMFVAVVSASLLLFWVASFLVVWRRQRVRERFETGEGEELERLALAKMIEDALTQPAAWGAVEGLWHRRILPTLHGQPMSVADAIRRGRQGRLWLTRSKSKLARMAAAAGTPVLDASDPIFRGVIDSLGRAIDLDAVAALQPTRDGRVGNLAVLLTSAERLFQDAGLTVRCLVCPGLSESPVTDVDLSQLQLPRRFPWPRQFFAINPKSRSVVARVDLANRRPGRGLFVWMDWLLDRSELLAPCADELRGRAASIALREPP